MLEIDQNGNAKNSPESAPNPVASEESQAKPDSHLNEFGQPLSEITSQGKVDPHKPTVVVAKSVRNWRGIFLSTLILLIVAGGAAYYYQKYHPFAHKAASKSSASQSTSSKTTHSSPSFFVSYSGLNGLTDNNFHYSKFDLATGTEQSILAPNTGTKRVFSVVNLNGTTRSFIVDETPTSNNYPSTVISYQDGAAAEKTLYTLTAKSTTAEAQVFEGPVTKDGKNVYIYEQKYTPTGTAGTDIKQLHEDGTSSIIIDGNVETAAKKDIPNLKGLLVPSALSSDEKVLYLQNYACLACDGGGYSNLIAYNLDSKKFAKVASDPAVELGGWTALGNDKFIIDATNVPGLGLPSYEESLAFKTNLTLYDAKTNTSKPIVNLTGDDATVIGHSDDAKTVYVAYDKLTKGSVLTDQKQPAHQPIYVKSEYRAYDTSTGHYTVVKLPVDNSQQAVNYMYSTNGTLVYSVGQAPAANADGQHYDSTAILYTLASTAGAQPKQLLKTQGTLQILGFSQ